MSEKMGMKQLVSFARHCACILAVNDKKYLAEHKVMALEQPPFSLELTPPNFFLFLRLKKFSKRTKFCKH
jgi:hypothetical protein